MKKPVAIILVVVVLLAAGVGGWLWYQSHQDKGLTLYGNVDIRVLQDILGHENLGTTEIYTHTSSKQMEEAVNANPLSKMREKTDKNEK